MYLVLAGILGSTVLLLVPSFAAASIASEWEDRTMELLMASPLKPFRIVAGKMLSSICLTLLFIVAGMPFLSLVFVIGGVEKRYLLELLLVLAVESVFTGSIGVYLSALSRKTDTAGIRSYLAAMGAGIGTILIVAVVYILRKQRWTSGRGQSGERFCSSFAGKSACDVGFSSDEPYGIYREI